MLKAQVISHYNVRLRACHSLPPMDSSHAALIPLDYYLSRALIHHDFEAPQRGRGTLRGPP